MDTLEAIRSRKTIREFDRRDIPPATLKRILEAGMCAPSNDHMRQWQFVLMMDRAVRENLVAHLNAPKTKEGAEAIVNQWGLEPGLQREMYLEGIPRQHSMILNCPVLIIPCFRVHAPLLNPENLSALNPYASMWCCIENILIAAASEGISGVTRIPLGDENQRLHEIAQIPTDYEVACFLCLGYPAKNARRAKQVESRIEEHVHLDHW
jgi:nitroreductase